MKKTILISLVVLITSLNTFSQNKTVRLPLFTFCGQTGDCEMTIDQFKKCKKELTPVNKDEKINSFLVYVIEYTNNRKDTAEIDFQNKGSMFTKETIDGIDKLIMEKKDIKKIVIDNIKIQKGKEEYTSWLMTIKIK
jgi:hypothetical protein